jgi:hypothetical protein
MMSCIAGFDYYFFSYSATTKVLWLVKNQKEKYLLRWAFSQPFELGDSSFD